MKLFGSATSPFARKATLLVHEKGAADLVDVEQLDPWQTPEHLVSHNPLSKVPTLVLDDYRVILDSDVICEYLDGHLPGNKLFPAPGDAYWHTRAMAAMSNGVLEASIAVFIETVRRPEERRWEQWVQFQRDSMTRALDEFEKQVDRLATGFDYAAICVVAALGHLEFRHTLPNWRRDHPKLAAWADEQRRRPSVAATQPAEPVSD